MWNGWFASGSVLLAGPGSKCPPALVNGSLALADGMQVNAVEPGLEPARRDRDLDDGPRALPAFDQLGAARDAFARDLRLRLHPAASCAISMAPEKAATAPVSRKSLPFFIFPPCGILS